MQINLKNANGNPGWRDKKTLYPENRVKGKWEVKQ